MLTMHFLTTVSLAFLVVTTSVLASPLHSRSSPYTIKDSHTVPPGWSNIGSAPPGHLIRLQIGLKQSRFSELERHLYEGRTALSEAFGVRTNVAQSPIPSTTVTDSTSRTMK